MFRTAFVLSQWSWLFHRFSRHVCPTRVTQPTGSLSSKWKCCHIAGIKLHAENCILMLTHTTHRSMTHTKHVLSRHRTESTLMHLRIFHQHSGPPPLPVCFHLGIKTRCIIASLLSSKAQTVFHYRMFIVELTTINPLFFCGCKSE